MRFVYVDIFLYLCSMSRVRRKSFEKELLRRFDNLTFDVITERKPNSRTGELENIRVYLYYHNDDHVATWDRGMGTLI